MSKFLENTIARAKADKKTIVLPESMDRRTFEAAAKVLKEDIADLIIIGTPEEIEENSKGLDISKAKIVNPYTYEKTDEYLNLFVELRKNKGLTYEEAKKTVEEQFASNPAWSSVNAINEGRVIYLPQQYYLYNAGPYYVDAIKYMAQSIYPEIYGEVEETF